MRKWLQILHSSKCNPTKRDRKVPKYYLSHEGGSHSIQIALPAKTNANSNWKKSNADDGKVKGQVERSVGIQDEAKQSTSEDVSKPLANKVPINFKNEAKALSTQIEKPKGS